MKNRTSKWIGGWMLVIGGCDPFPHDDDDGGGSEESSDSGNVSATSGWGESGGSVSMTTWGDDGGSVSVTGWGEEGGETTTSTGTTSHGTTESCSVGDESTVSATSYGGTEDDGGSTTIGGGALEACGVELEFAELNNSYICGCENCEVQYDGLTHESADGFLNACDCICDALGCGVSISGGVSDEGGEDVGEGTASDTDYGGEDGGSATTGGSEVTGAYEDG